MMKLKFSIYKIGKKIKMKGIKKEKLKKGNIIKSIN